MNIWEKSVKEVNVKKSLKDLIQSIAVGIVKLKVTVLNTSKKTGNKNCKCLPHYCPCICHYENI